MNDINASGMVTITVDTDTKHLGVSAFPGLQESTVSLSGLLLCVHHQCGSLFWPHRRNFQKI